LNLSAYYNIRLGKSHFTISPGIGIGFEGYQFKKQNKRYNTLVRCEDDSRHTEFEDVDTLLPYRKKILQSSLDVKYSDFLLEFRFNANSKYPKESFFVALGGKLGMLWGASTTIRYQEDGETKERVIYESFNLNKLRYGLHARVGWERLSVFYTHIFSNLFSKGKGPDKTTTEPGTIGLSIDLF
ncbi:MAG: outer membrane beta-barrel protein, partial [Bacteroidota bacterium]